MINYSDNALGEAIRDVRSSPWDKEIKMADPKSYYFDLPSSKRPSEVKLSEEWFPDIKSAALRTSKSRGRDPIKGVKTVVIHATAGSNSAGAASVIFNGDASFHWLVPDENEPQHGHFVWATCYESRAAYHVRKSVSHPKINDGQKDINRISLGIEIVNAQVSSDSFSEWQVEATAKIVRYAWAKYPNLENVVSHATLDPSRRTDPGRHFPWERFRREVLEAREENVPTLVAMARTMLAGAPAGSCCMDRRGFGAETA
jgi:N-acetyl-anhydromuramyl-L-alanine amidase AmpD